jgi:alpha-beta hydrolase superfamily lysophospholipase
MSDSSTPLSAARRARASRGAPSRGKSRRIRKAPKSAVAALLGAARDRRLAQESERLERFAREFKELQRALHELLTAASESRLEAEAARLQRAIEDEALRAESRSARLAG